MDMNHNTLIQHHGAHQEQEQTHQCPALSDIEPFGQQQFSGNIAFFSRGVYFAAGVRVHELYARCLFMPMYLHMWVNFPLTGIVDMIHDRKRVTDKKKDHMVYASAQSIQRETVLQP